MAKSQGKAVISGFGEFRPAAAQCHGTGRRSGTIRDERTAKGQRLL
jgi:hypothetical protein